MEFCPKCGAMLMSKKCSRCSYESDTEIKLETSEKVKIAKEIVVVNESDNEVNPIIDEECPKCNNTKAFFWTKQTRAGDEAETQFLKCTKCKHSWRKYR